MPSLRTSRETDSGDVIRFRATPYQEVLTGPVRPVLYALFGALALVLLIACANVSNLLIARCLGRQQEFAVRAALGAGRWRLARQMLSEGMLLSLIGCGAGVMLARAAMIAVSKLPEGTIPRADSIAIHWTVVLVLAAIAIVVTVLVFAAAGASGGAFRSAGRVAVGFPRPRVALGERQAERRAGCRRGGSFHAASGGDRTAVSHSLES